MSKSLSATNNKYSASPSLNYDKWLTKKSWPLKDAVQLMYGNDPNPAFPEHTSHTYKLAEQAINSGELEELGTRVFENEDIKIIPRTYITWLIENNIEIDTAWKERCSYAFWTQKEYWYFNEAVLLLDSADYPLPKDIFNTLESSKTNELATQLCDAVKRGLVDFRREGNGLKQPVFRRALRARSVMEWAKEQNTPYNKALEKVIANWKTIDGIRASKKPKKSDYNAKAERDFEDWFVDHITMHPKPIKEKGQYRDDAKNMFPGLSTRGFNRVWKEISNSNYTKPGRRKTA